METYSKLIRTSVAYPLEEKGDKAVIATLNNVVRLIQSKAFTADFINQVILNCNAIFIIMDEAKKPSEFLGDVGDILIQINNVLSSSDKLTQKEKEEVSEWLMHAIDSI